jgi:hypothetical protein
MSFPTITAATTRVNWFWAVITLLLAPLLLSAWRTKSERGRLVGGGIVMAYAALRVGIDLAGSDVRVHRDFYSLTAQILPILVLALVIEARFLRGDAEDMFPKIAAVFILSLGEASALVEVARGDEYVTSRASFGQVVASLVCALAALIALGPTSVEKTEEENTTRDAGGKGGG